MDFKETLNLPDPAFTIPMKADLGLREPEIQEAWFTQDPKQGIYHKIQESRKDAPTFVLHDGPPYTNSPIHIGTALNKLLKDFVVKSRTLMGYRAPFVPGFDNHGLPIEQTVMKAFHEKKETPDVVTLRKACREHAAKYIDIQTQQFKRLGIFGLWERPYATMEFKYEAEIIRIFKRMVENGYVYKGLRPTLWSPTSRTALADTEIVYVDNFVSQSIYVRFPFVSDANGWAKGFENLFAMIWTTTPWTIPANLAVAFHPNFDYVVVKSGDAHYLVLKDLSDKVRDAIGAEEWTVVADFLGCSFEGSKFKHPIFDRESIAVMAEYVTTEDGTGIVHTAPGHGRDDFYTGIKNDLAILCPVDERGMMTDEAGEFAGISYRDCNARVVERLQEVGNLLSVSDYLHSYPHAERDGKPVIFRATEQWFVGIDTNDLRRQMLSQIKNKTLEEVDNGEDGVCWLPANGHNRIEAMISNRPDWCISRQRPWGVGIPILYGAESGHALMDPDVIELIAKRVEEEGSDVWFENDASYFLPQGYKHPETGETEFRKETDVLDVWFDSGCTSLCVLDGAVEPQWKENWPADLYLEGSDQHRGWFNTSLIIGTAIKGQPPYKTVLTHGFVDDEKGEKMSKRSGNSIDPVTACDTYGADTLRLWVASVDWTNDAPCGPNLLAQVGGLYRRIRNTLRFLLSNLSDYPTEGDLPTTDGTRFNWNAIDVSIQHNDSVWATEHQLLPLDRWIMEQVDLLVLDGLQAYREYDFGAAIAGIHNFCAEQLSAFYLDAIKDRMYCDGADWNTRRSGQVACHYVLVRLTKLVAPILAHTAEEVWQRIPGLSHEPTSVHLAELDSPSPKTVTAIQDSDLQRQVAAALEWRAFVFAQFEPWKVANNAKDSQDFVVHLTLPQDQLALLKSFGEELATIFRVSDVQLEIGDSAAEFSASPYEKCERSRIRRASVQEVNGRLLSERDRRAIGWK